MELVVEHFMDKGTLATWHLDSASYSSRGHRACLSAQSFPQSHPDAYFMKAARHIMIGNRKTFYQLVHELGYSEALNALKGALSTSPPGGFAEAARQWLARMQTGIFRTSP
jgi:hypothetical protein